MARTCCFPFSRTAKFSLWVLTLDGKRESPFGNVQSNEPLSATFSPDGRWIAYTVNEGAGGMSVTEQRCIRAAVSQRPASSIKCREECSISIRSGRRMASRFSTSRARRERRSRFPSRLAQRSPSARPWSCRARQGPCCCRPMCEATMCSRTADSSRRARVRGWIGSPSRLGVSCRAELV